MFKRKTKQNKTKTLNAQTQEQNGEDRGLRNLWNYHKRSNIHVIGVQKRGGEKVGLNQLWKMTENLPNLAKDINLQIQKAKQTPKKLNPKKFMPNTSYYNFLKLNGRE